MIVFDNRGKSVCHPCQTRRSECGTTTQGGVPLTQAQPKPQEDRSILINFVLDKSGSMGAIRDATISGFNEFLGDQQAEGGSAAMTLTLFDTRFKTTASAVPVADVPPLDHTSYEPSGMTALYDAIAHTMKITDDFVARAKPDQVLFVIMTDGQENSSLEYTRDQIFAMIEQHQRTSHYEFLYLGANQDAYEVSRSMGIREGRSLTYEASPAEARATMERVSHNVKAHRRVGEEVLMCAEFFSPEFEEIGRRTWEEHREERDGKEEATENPRIWADKRK